MEYLNDKGKFKQGNPGRKPGSKNKVPEEIRQKIVKFLHKDWNNFLVEIDSLSKTQKVRAKLELLSFVLSKPKYVEISGNLNTENLSGSIASSILLELYGDKIPPETRKRYESRLQERV